MDIVLIKKSKNFIKIITLFVVGLTVLRSNNKSNYTKVRGDEYNVG